MTLHWRQPLQTLACVCLFVISAAAIAATPTTSSIQVEHAWIRWLPANLPVGGYATVRNDSDGSLRLTGASSPDFGMVMLMQSRLADNDSSMVDAPFIDVPAHGQVKLAPGGYHLMLSHARHSIKPGDKVPVTLHFANGATLQVDFSVLPANATGPSD
ncbi:MAG TPA: copper chaperone PCu(A)C [Rhodanobacteraceae bacterium]